MNQIRKYLLGIFLGFFSLSAMAQNLNGLISSDANQFMANNGVPGVAIALYYQGQPYFFNYGVANQQTNQVVDKNTIFEIGSVTKVFTATLLALEIQAGTMSLNSPVTNFLPSQVKAAGGAINQVTLEELATHMSSLPRTPPNVKLRQRTAYTKEQLMNFIANWQPSTPIGSTYLYSNIGFGILGDALEGATGKSYDQLLQQEIFTPLQMNSSSLNMIVDETRYAQGYSKTGDPAMRWPANAWPAGGAIRSTAADMMNFLKANLGVQGNSTLINAMIYAQQPRVNVNQKFIQGLAWSVWPNGTVRKDGATVGFSSFIELKPSQKIGVVILANRSTVPVAKLANSIIGQLSQ